MSTQQLPKQSPTTSDAEKYAQAMRAAAVLAVVACPVVALLPPRKLDFYTVGLIGTTVYGANHLTRDYTGRSLWQHATRQQRESPGQAVPGSLVGQLQTQARGAQNVEAPVGTLARKREEWKAERQNEIQEELEEGKGFGDMIMDQIWEVWNWGKPKQDEHD
ncbi:uncharacterized protein K489DRAFT_311465 [Dissoconium aciculare CBS 342.82]|uniref:Uncharacterized protein n=1 Tax=Dissoconium aciculare CBS 342.82 TaxID=1314786 RepID=A0A6J3MGL2_9PEZI|nr:uncharacterized protein K489DRAFT_311465 [Dissoconium aciculare CBS 342.82]KAF1827090.1 hypothetical protein K489DRAFT_311465 [Dissoconium aciculare CBS 342.82]